MVIQAESHRGELAALVEWDFDAITHEMYDQPMRVKLKYLNQNGRVISHMSTPDYFLLQEGFAGWVECKAESWLREQEAKGSGLFVKGADGKWICSPGEEYAAQFGLKFLVRSSAETSWNKNRNVEFLADYLDERCPSPKQDEMTRIHDAMKGQAWLTLKQLIDLGCDSDTTFKMVADGQLYVDLDLYLLAEPERAMVFKDRMAGEAYRINHENRKLPVVEALYPVKLESGGKFIWDGKHWEIINPGDQEVTFINEERVIASLQTEVLQRLIKEGKVTGLPENGINVSELVEGLIRKASPADFKHALFRYKCLFPDIGQEGQVPPVTTRAIRKWRKLYMKSEEAYGSGFIGILPTIHKRGNRERKIDPAVIEIMHKIIDEWFLQPGGKKKTVCWGEVRNICIEKGYPPPSERTFREEIKRLAASKVTVAREGEKAAYAQSEFIWSLERTAPRHGERPFEIGHIDHTELDLQFVGARRGEKLNKAWLTIMVDALTRMVLAWVLSFEEPSYRSCMMVIRECIKRHGRIPQYIVVDKGPEFEGEYFECLLATLESHKKTRPASKPRFGSIVERYFGLNNEAFVHNLVGNNTPLQKPRTMSATHDPRELAIWTLPAFRDAFEGFLDKVYSNLEHPALGMSPKEAMDVGMKLAGVRRHMMIPYTQSFSIMCMPPTRNRTVRVDSGRGVKIGYIYYWTPEFRDPKHAKADVPARYDPFDKSTAFVWLRNHWVVCRSELAAEFEGRTEREINDATQELTARHKREGSRRAINAQMIAAYLREISGTEEDLRRQARKEDARAAQDYTAAPMSITASKQCEAAPIEDDWSNLNLKIFGEF